MPQLTDKLRGALRAPLLTVPKTRGGCLSTGSILLDRMLAVEQECAIRQGDVIWFHGTSGSCRTFLAHQILAEAANNTLFTDYKLFYDNPANARPSVDFGTKYKERVEFIASQTVADWLARLNTVGDDGRCVYVLDSVNALHGEPVENAKLLNTQIRNICQEFHKNQSILLFISDNINSFTPDTTRTLRDVPDIILHFQQLPPKEEQRYSVTTDVKITVQKRATFTEYQRTSQYLREFDFTFIADYGIDDALACFNFLCIRKLIKPTPQSGFKFERLNMSCFTFEDFVEEFDDIKPLIKPLLI